MGFNNMKGFGSGMMEEDWFKRQELIGAILQLSEQTRQAINGDIQTMTTSELETELERLKRFKEGNNN